MTYFFFGALIADIAKHRAYFFKKVPTIVKILIAILVVYLGSYPVLTHPDAVQSGPYSLLNFLPTLFYFPLNSGPYIASMLLFFVIASSPRLQAVLNKKWLIYLGTISFPFYVIHETIIRSIGAWLFINTGFMPSSLQYPATILFSFLSSILSAIILTKLIDQPSVKVANTIGKKVKR